MTPALTVLIPGKPRGQGSMTLARDPRTGREFARYGTDTITHRNLVVEMLHRRWAGRPPLTSPIEVRVLAELQRPKSHFGTGRNAGRLKDNAPQWATTYPDGDKVARLVGDALTIAGVIDDDALIARWHVEKRYAATAPATTIEVIAL